MSTVLQALEVFAHVRCFPRGIACEVSDGVPSRVMRINQNNLIMRGRAPQGSHTGIENSISRGCELRGLFLAPVARVMPHKKIPLHRRILRRKGMKGRNRVVFG